MKIKSKILFFTILFCALFVCAESSQAANYPLQITNIKPAGTGSPAIPPTNIIFRAYPGIEYNIRPAINGGAYPFAYALSGQPSGMTINATTGEISWPNPQSNSGTITVTVTDAETTQVSASWAITVSASGFYFVDSSAVTNGSGSLVSPYNSLINAMTGIGTYNGTAILYFRGGTYDLVHNDHNSGEADLGAGVDAAQMLINTSVNPGTNNWIGYPGETAVVHGNNTQVMAYGPVYWDNLTIGAAGSGNGFNHRALQFISSVDYITIRRSIFTNLDNPSGTNNNQNFFICYMEETPGYYLTIQDNDFSAYRGAGTFGSIYNRRYTVVEDNYMHDGGLTGTGGLTFTAGLAFKRENYNVSVRHNRVFSLDGAPETVGVYNSVGGTDIEMDHNLFVHLGATSNQIAFGFYYTPNLRVHHNTMVGNIVDYATIANYPDCTSIQWPNVPHYFNNNVIINDNANYSGEWATSDYFSAQSPVNGYPSTAAGVKQCLTDTDNLKSTTISGVIDANYNLVNRSYVGTYGWETVSESVDVIAPSAPLNLAVQ